MDTRGQLWLFLNMCNSKLLGEVLGYAGGCITECGQHTLKPVFILVFLNGAGDSERADTIMCTVKDWNSKAADSDSKLFIVKSISLFMTFVDFFHKSGFICDCVVGQFAEIAGIDRMRAFFFR